MQESSEQQEKDNEWKKKRRQKQLFSIEKAAELLRAIMNPTTSPLQKAKYQFELYESVSIGLLLTSRNERQI